MNEKRPRLPPDSPVLELADAIRLRGGRVIIVGGWVRDRLLGKVSHDLDLEVFGVSRASLSEWLGDFGFSPPVGRRFPVWRQTRLGIDVGFPRGGTEAIDPGVRPESADADDPRSLARAFRAAARHRDLTINAIGWDPLADRLFDPFEGRSDLAAGRLRAVDESTFGADPLRVLRVARLHAELAADVDPTLRRLCREAELDSLPVERIAGELRRLLIEGARPSSAFEFLAEVGQLEVFGPLARLRGIPQDPRWHPEGDVFVHTLQVVDRAAEIARPLPEGQREALLLAALCHDFGKAQETRVEGDRIRAHGHEATGADIARDWLALLRLPDRLVRAVGALVANHLAPMHLPRQDAGAGAYRRLARKLALAGVTVVDLERLARADHLGREAEGRPAAGFPEGQRFLEAARAAGVGEGVPPDVVSASCLLEAGIEPGPRLGELLARCREIQDEIGSRDPEAILERVMDRTRPDGGAGQD